MASKKPPRELATCPVCDNSRVAVRKDNGKLAAHKAKSASENCPGTGLCLLDAQDLAEQAQHADQPTEDTWQDGALADDDNQDPEPEPEPEPEESEPGTGSALQDDTPVESVQPAEVPVGWIPLPTEADHDTAEHTCEDPDVCPVCGDPDPGPAVQEGGMVLYLHTKVDGTPRVTPCKTSDDSTTSMSEELRAAIDKAKLTASAVPIAPAPRAPRAPRAPAPLGENGARPRRAQRDDRYIGPGGLNLKAIVGLLALHEYGHLAKATPEQLTHWLELAQERRDKARGTSQASLQWQARLDELIEEIRVAIQAAADDAIAAVDDAAAVDGDTEGSDTEGSDTEDDDIAPTAADAV